MNGRVLDGKKGGHLMIQQGGQPEVGSITEDEPVNAVGLRMSNTRYST